MDDLRVSYHMALEVPGAMALVIEHGIRYPNDHTLVEAHVHRTSHALPSELCLIRPLQTACIDFTLYLISSAMRGKPLLMGP